MNIQGTVDSLLKHKDRKNIWSISPDASVYHAIEVMSHKNIGALPVMEGEHLVGMFTERDYTRKVVLKGKTSKTTAVGEIVSKPVISVESATSIEDCMHLMTQHRIRHLPVLNNDQLMGIISIGDLVNWIISAQHHTIEQMEQFISGSYPG